VRHDPIQAATARTNFPRASSSAARGWSDPRWSRLWVVLHTDGALAAAPLHVAQPDAAAPLPLVQAEIVPVPRTRRASAHRRHAMTATLPGRSALPAARNYSPCSSCISQVLFGSNAIEPTPSSIVWSIHRVRGAPPAVREPLQRRAVRPTAGGRLRCSTSTNGSAMIVTATVC